MPARSCSSWSTTTPPTALRSTTSGAALAAAARAHGVEAVTVRHVDDLAPVAEWVRGGTGPMLVDAKVDPDICADWMQEAFRAG